MANNLSIGISELSYDIASNTSVIRVSVTAIFQYYASCTYATGATVNIDGVSIGFNAPSYNVGNGGSVLIGTFDRTITHNADGTRSAGASASWAPPYVYPGGLTFTGSAAINLTTIPRASSFSISGSTLGSAMSISIARASASFTHTVRYQFGSISRDYTGQTTSCSFTPPLSDASQIPSAVSGTGSITVFTYSGGTMVGSKSSSFTLNLPSSVVPSFSSLSITRVDNGVPSAWNTYVQGISKATLSIVNASGIYGSSISSYSITGGGYSGTSTLTTGTLGAGTITFTGTISDSRGRTASKTVSITVVENRLPSLSIKAERCDVNGKEVNEGTYIKITPTYSCSSINSNNTIATKSFAITGTSYTNTTCASGSFIVLGAGIIAVSKSYEVSGVVMDTLKQSSGTIKVTIPSSSVPINIRDDATGIGFGKYSERKNAIDSNWDLYIKGISIINMIVPIGTIIQNNQISYNPNMLYQGTTWVRYAQGRVLVGVNESETEFSTIGKTGGNKALQSHNHNASTSIEINGEHTHAKRSASYWMTETVDAWLVGAVNQGSFWGYNAHYPIPSGSHSHTASTTITSSGSGNAQNLQPYIAVYMWVRTA